MIVVTCVEDRLGMAFGGRRVSRDAAQIMNMVQYADGRPIYIHPRSKALFDGTAANLFITEQPLSETPDDALCFVEFAPISGALNRITTLVLYRWNRRYPADLFLDLPISEQTPTEQTEFEGTSHERITREVYSF